MECLKAWNLALVFKHIWNLVTKKKFVWVNWIYKERLSKVNFWECQASANSCWGWRKIIQNRDLFRNRMLHKLGNGMKTLMWYDNWHSLGLLIDLVSRRRILKAGFSLTATVANVIRNGDWCWPDEWRARYGFLFDFPPPFLISSKNDAVMWKNKNGEMDFFSVKNSWDCIREESKIPWAKLIWFSQCIPRHSFVVWLAIRNRLKTQDKLIAWGVQKNLLCPLCKSVPDSQDHLFFNCNYSKQIWDHVKLLAKLENAPSSLSSLVLFFQGIPLSKSIWSIIRRLVVGAIIYNIWQERNFRLFKNISRPTNDVIVIIKKNVRMRLIGLKIKKSANVFEAANIWDFPMEYGKFTGKL